MVPVKPAEQVPEALNPNPHSQRSHGLRVQDSWAHQLGRAPYAVEWVAHQRVPHGGHVDPDLVRPPCTARREAL